MITEAAVRARLAEHNISDVDAVVAAAREALAAVEPGAWTKIKAARADAKFVNPAKSGELDRRIAAGGAEPAAADALEAVARAVMSLAVETSDTGPVQLGEAEYAFGFATPSKGGRTRLRLKAPDAPAVVEEEAPAEEPAEG